MLEVLEVLEVPGIGGILPWKPLSISCGPLLIPLRCPAGSSLFVSCIDYFEWILPRKNLNRGLWFFLLNDFCFFVFKLLRKSMIAFGVWHWMPILVFVFLPLSVYLRLRRLFVGLDEYFSEGIFLRVDVLVFSCPAGMQKCWVISPLFVYFLLFVNPRFPLTPSGLPRITRFEFLERSETKFGWFSM